jgi:hypothetical protein
LLEETGLVVSGLQLFWSGPRPPEPGVGHPITMYWFCGRTDAVDQDIVLGESRWIGFIAPEQALDRDLSASAALMVPMLLSSDTYADLPAKFSRKVVGWNEAACLAAGQDSRAISVPTPVTAGTWRSFVETFRRRSALSALLIGHFASRAPRTLHRRGLAMASPPAAARPTHRRSAAEVDAFLIGEMVPAAAAILPGQASIPHPYLPRNADACPRPASSGAVAKQTMAREGVAKTPDAAAVRFDGRAVSVGHYELRRYYLDKARSARTRSANIRAGTDET